jgi:hypothetical protein
MRFASPSCSRVLILAALCAVLAAAAVLAASAPQPPASFLASLSADPPPAVSGVAQLPSTGALFLSGCAGGCPPGQICCPLGGADPEGGGPTYGCIPTPPHGKCPPVQ